MINIPVLRWGTPYSSMDADEVVHFLTGEPIAKVSRANAGLIQRDMRKASAARDALRKIPIAELIDRMKIAGDLYMNAVLPIGTYAEGDGTFTNHAQRVQRFRQAVALPGQARAGWQVLGDLLADASGAPASTSASAVFETLAAEGGAFAGLDYERLGGAGVVASANRS